VDTALLIKAAVMGIIEGLTEFLPISSTGHLILTASLIGFTGDMVKVFEIAIQTGAMFAVIWQYRERLGNTAKGITHDPVAQRFALNVLVAFIPTMVVGVTIYSFIKKHLFHPVPVAVAFIVGGLVILMVEAYHKRRYGHKQSPPERIQSVDDMTPLDAVKVGLLQCLGMIPGTSRSGATIIGSLMLGFSRKAATEFSFYLGIPTLMGAGAYSVWKQRALLHASDIPVFLVGTAFAFVFALLCIRWLIRFVSSHDFSVFAWYRIVFGLLVLLTAWQGWVVWEA
jgi:undecaprenyl-diphosphatase